MLGVLAAATSGELADAIAHLGELPATVDLKPAETGLVMLRGRIGGDGAPFNVGEATVTRVVVRIATGEVGYGYRLGRDRGAARNAALIDALWQASHDRAGFEAGVLDPIRARVAAESDRASREAAASRVDFFTLARETT